MTIKPFNALRTTVPLRLYVAVALGLAFVTFGANASDNKLCNGPWAGKTIGRDKFETLTAIAKRDKFIPLSGWLRTDVVEPHRQKQSWQTKGDNFVLIWPNLCGAIIDTDASGIVFYKIDLRNARVMSVQLSGAQFIDSRLDGISFAGTLLGGAEFRSVHMDGAYFSAANLRKAVFIGNNAESLTSLVGSSFVDVDMEEAMFSNVDLSGSVFEPISGRAPRAADIQSVIGLETLRYRNSSHALHELREGFRMIGNRENERKLTYAIGRENARRLPWLERVFRTVFFDWTVGYGLYPGRALKIIGFGVLFFMVIYVFPIQGNFSRFGKIIRIWPADRVLTNSKNARLSGIAKAETLRAAGLAAWRHAFYFSVISAFHLGWRDLNIGSWISRLQTQEFTFRATSHVRVVAGVQSLITVYLLALWALSYFGRPFES